MKNMGILFLLSVLFLSFSCSSTKEKGSNLKLVTAEKPTPIGGDDEVRDVFKVLLDQEYEAIKGVNVEFTMWVNQDGYIDYVEQVIGMKENHLLGGAIVSKLKEIMIKHIRFTYYKVEDQYQRGRLLIRYSITF